jgi:hypothetical protein
MAVIEIPTPSERNLAFAEEVEQILDEVRRLRALVDAWDVPAAPPEPGRPHRAAVIPIDVRRARA